MARSPHEADAMTREVGSPGRVETRRDLQRRSLSGMPHSQIAGTYSSVYTACARFGMSTQECRRYARDAVGDSMALIEEIDLAKFEEGMRGGE